MSEASRSIKQNLGKPTVFRRLSLRGFRSLEKLPDRNRFKGVDPLGIGFGRQSMFNADSPAAEGHRFVSTAPLCSSTTKIKNVEATVSIPGQAGFIQ